MSVSSSNDSSASSRFSLILLEPGEIYFEDYLVYYHELNSPFEANVSSAKQRSSNFSSSDASFGKQLKGNLKICSKSIVFDPINLSYPLVKFPFKSVEKIEKFDSDAQDENDLEDIYSTYSKTTTSSSIDKTKWFGIRAKQSILCKKNNKIEPYTTVKRDNPQDVHYFQLSMWFFTLMNIPHKIISAEHVFTNS